MSAKLMGQVYELKLTHSQQSIALALADHGHDDGSSIRPGIDYLEWKTGYSARNIIRTLQELEAIKLLVPVDGQSIGRGNVQEYLMDIAAVPKKEPFQRHRQRVKHDSVSRYNALKHDSVSPIIKGDILSKGDNSDTQKVTNQTLKGDNSDTHHIEYPRPFEPSKNHHSEPSSTLRVAQPRKQKPQSTLAVLAADDPLHVAVKKALQINGSATPERIRIAEETAAALLADGRTPGEVERFVSNWWAKSFYGTRHKRKPKPEELRNDFDEILNLDKVSQNGQNYAPKLTAANAANDIGTRDFIRKHGINF